MLIGQFYGTSAGEGIPAPFCRCNICTEAREKGIPFARMRSCFRLTDKIMIDLGADAPMQARIIGDLADIEHILVTHTHEDHLNVHMVMEAHWCREGRQTTNYWFCEKAFDIVDKWRNNDWVIKGMTSRLEEEKVVGFHQIQFGVPTLIDGITFTALKGNHSGNVGENSAMYLIDLPDGRTLFYGLDSGPYLQETVDALKGRRVDIFISEATGGIKSLSGISRSHMCLDDVFALAQTLLAQGTLTKESKLYLTHINNFTSHSQMESRVRELNFPIETIVAYDGLRIL